MSPSPSACRPARHLSPMLLALAAATLLGGCGRDDRQGAASTGFPGQVTADGGTSGEVMSRAGAQVDTATGGTPGIPQGSGGTTSGAAMGGTSGGSSLGGTGDKTAAQAPAATPTGTPSDPSPAPTPDQAKATADAQAEREKQQLAAAMQRVSQRWRANAATEGWPTHAPTPVEPIAGIEASNRQSSASGQPGGKLGEVARDAPIPSEKLGTAPPSEDVKQPQAPDPGARP